MIKAIRNKFAHRVNVDFTSDSVKPLVRSLYEKVIIRTKSLIAGGFVPGKPEPEFDMAPYFEMTPEAGAGLLLSVFCVYQAYFHRLMESLPRITAWERSHVSLDVRKKTRDESH